MAFLQSLSPSTPYFLSQRHSLSLRNLKLLPKLPRRILKIPFPVLACSAPKSAPATEQDILAAVAASNGESLPCVRTYENELARLRVVGEVDFQQALTAAAADGGEAAAEHIDSGMRAMVVETVFPGPPDERSTVSTRLFLPARKVKEKAKKLKSSLPPDILSKATSSSILAMTFRQVILEQLWNFELVLFEPGTERNMEELENPREVPASVTLSSSDQRVISLLGEVVCLAALESTERHFLDKSLGRTSNNFFRWFHKPERIASTDSSVTMYKLFEDEIITAAKSLLEIFNSKKANYKPSQTNLYSWWTLSTHSELEKIGGPMFSAWISEYVPGYRLQIQADRLHNVKFEGWKKSTENRWEVLLTHSQMVSLANILDMYYEDSHTLPSKQLSCGVVAKTTNSISDKRIASLLKLVSVTLASGFFLIAIGVFGQLCLPYLHSGRKYPGGNHSLQSSKIYSTRHQAVESTKLEAFCISVVRKIKDAFGWPGDIMTEKSVGAWIGELPVFLRRIGEAGLSYREETPSSSASLKGSDEELEASTQDIASYQVVLSGEGKIVGFQPTSRAAINHWATNPLAKELYGGRKLSPGFIEPGLKISPPTDLVVIELLMSLNPNSEFALARPAE